MIQEWNDRYSPWGNDTEWAGKSYWIATENWPQQNYHTNKSLYNNPGGFQNGFVPLFGVIGPDNEVYFVGNTVTSALNMLRIAIMDFEE